ncbi:hypothetical protein [Phaeobacter phage MD18]|nr:hypothetical protein [Phaeobacter phage MD18]
MDHDRKTELVTGIGKARRELNSALSEAIAAGLRVDVSTIESKTISGPFPRVQMVTQVFEKLD